MSEVSKPTGGRHSGLLTLKYFGAGFSAIVSALALLGLLSLLITTWSGGEAASMFIVTSAIYGLMISLAVTGAVFAVIALLLYRIVTKEIAARPGYISSTPYIVITNAVFGVFVLLLVGYVIGLISTVISSLVMIGSGADIGAMYLHKFLPDLVGAGFVFVMAMMTYKIARGKNMSLPMSIVLLSVAGALLVATLITIPVKIHSSSSTKPSKSSSYDYLFEE